MSVTDPAPTPLPIDDPRWRDSETAFACPWFAVQRSGSWHRITGAGGALALARTPAGLIFVEIYRPATGRRHLELPRGGRAHAAESDVACALRELLEETGHRADPASARLIGRFHPDAGLCGPTPLGVVAARADAAPVRPGDGEVVRPVMVSEADLPGMIAVGTIDCGITLAALALDSATRRVAKD